MKIQPKDVVDVAFYWDQWSRCVNSRYQRDQFYRFGEFDNCSKQWNDFKIAGKAKLADTEEEAARLLATTYYSKRSRVSPTVGVIWEAKETPSWQ